MSVELPLIFANSGASAVGSDGGDKSHTDDKRMIYALEYRNVASAYHSTKFGSCYVRITNSTRHIDLKFDHQELLIFIEWAKKWVINPNKSSITFSNKLL